MPPPRGRRGLAWLTVQLRFCRVLLPTSVLWVRPQLVASPSGTERHRPAMVPRGLRPGCAAQWSAACPGRMPAGPASPLACRRSSCSSHRHGESLGAQLGAGGGLRAARGQPCVLAGRKKQKRLAEVAVGEEHRVLREVLLDILLGQSCFAPCPLLHLWRLPAPTPVTYPTLSFTREEIPSIKNVSTMKKNIQVPPNTFFASQPTLP